MWSTELFTGFKMSVFAGMKQKDQSSPDFSVFSGNGLSDQEYNVTILP